MHYETQFEMCATLFLLVITVRYFSIRHFPDRTDKFAGAILVCAVFDLVLDIVGSYTVEFAATVPVVLNYLINTVFYCLQIIFPALLLGYVLFMMGEGHLLRGKYRWLFLPAALIVLVLLSNPWTGLIFSMPVVDGVRVFTHGALFMSLFIGSAFYMITIGIILFANKSRVRRDQFIVILLFLLIIMVAMFFQILFPHILLTGVAMTLAIMMMFFTLQNPENMLDMVSGVFNYDALNEFLRVQILEEHPVQLIAMDIGGVRRINSSYGINVGNAILRQVGTFLNETCGKKAWAFRMIGTRFLVVTRSDTDYSRILQSLEQRFKEPWHTEGKEFKLMATIRHFPQLNSFTSPQEAVNLVDLAYFQNDNPGWGSTRACGTELLESARRTEEVEEAVRLALDTGKGFYLKYQPLYSAKKDRFISAEALLRLEDPVLGTISPDEFISVAERTGLIFQIDRAVISAAWDFFRRHSELSEYGFEFMEINFSSAEFGRETAELERFITSQKDVSPKSICFEITETVTVRYEEVLRGFMARMNALGYHFALDDFGTGHANIMQLTSLPFNMVKMDRSLLVAPEQKNRRVFEDLLNMFEDVGLETVVEGVETSDHKDRVRALGADYLQGYLFSEPLSEEDFISFLRADAKARSELASTQLSAR